MQYITIKLGRMKKLALIAIALFVGTFVKAQVKPTLNHIAIYVVNLEKSTVFYRDVIGIDTIPEPFHDGRHTWFRIGPLSHLHVISGAAGTVAHDKNAHLCFRVDAVGSVCRKTEEGRCGV